MKLFLLAGFLLFLSLGFSQSKGKQIKILSNRIDSIQKVLESNKNSFEVKKSALENSISTQEKRINSITDSLNKVSDKKSINLSVNQKMIKKIEKLQRDLDSTNREIQKIIDAMPLRMVNGFSSNYSNQSLIKLFNIAPSQVTHCVPNTFEIIGKQDFIVGLDSFSCIVLGVTSKDNFHPASGINYIGLFKYSNNKLNLLFKPVEAPSSFGFGSYGSIEQFVILGKKSLGVILNGGYGGQGVQLENRSIYLVNSSHIVNLLDMDKSTEYMGSMPSVEYSKGLTEWKIKFIESKKDIYDLEITEKRNGKKVKTKSLKYNPKNMKYE